MKRRLAIIGANDFQNQLILKAKELGYETHVFAWEDGSIGKSTADYFYPISIVKKEDILEKCNSIKPDGVCSIASDLAIITVNYVAENLGLTGNPTSITHQCTNKYAMRKVMQQHGIGTPTFLEVNDNKSSWAINHIEFPAIVKPTDRSGSRGITKVMSKDDLENAITNAINCSFERKAITEEFIDGDEYSCECISWKGKHKCLAFTQKFTTGAPNFIETGHTEPSNLKEESKESIKETIFNAINALGIINGASHTEFKINKDGKVSIIEVGARMGGDCIGSDLVQLSTGYDYMKMVIDVACGEEPNFEKINKPQRATIKFIFSNNDLQDMNSFIEHNPNRIYRKSKMDLGRLGNTVDSSSRIGYYIYTD